MNETIPEVSNFRKNFEYALELDGRSLNQLRKDLGMSIAHLSRIKTGTEATESGSAITPTLGICERIANSLGYFVRDFLLPPSEFRKLADARVALSKPAIANSKHRA